MVLGGLWERARMLVSSAWRGENPWLTVSTVLAPATTAASATVESMPSALDSTAEAGPSRQTAPAKRKYEVDVVDREFCRKVSLSSPAYSCLTSFDAGYFR